MKYRIRDPGERPIEFWDEEYGMADYTNKVVMDVGADWGRTADYFLQKGAKMVIAIEGREDRYEQLKANAEIIGNTIPVFMMIEHPIHFAQLIEKYCPHIMKVDCEGCEEHLFNVSDVVYRSTPEYIIETHGKRMFEAMKAKCARNSYKIVEIRHDDGIKVVYVRRS